MHAVTGEGVDLGRLSVTDGQIDSLWLFQGRTSQPRLQLMSPSITPTNPPTVADWQREMRFAYFGGAPGVLTSAVAWLVAGVVSVRLSSDRAIWALFIGGMLIHPVSLLLTKALGRPAKNSSKNPFAALAIATTVWMILMLPLAYGVSRLRIEWFFPAMLFIIGGRYLVFSSIYGARTFWLCGATLALAGFALGQAGAPPTFSAFSGAAIEGGFAIALFISSRREIPGSHPNGGTSEGSQAV